jgi:hypothetical protein
MSCLNCKQERMKDTREADSRASERAAHGGRTEVNWDGGKGRQRYANQGDREAPPPAGTEAEAGDRGDASGRNLEQLEQVKKLP